jgi:hypothetical protein
MVGGQKLKPSELELFDRDSTLPAVIPVEAGIQDFLDLATIWKMDACPGSCPGQALRRHDRLIAYSLFLDYDCSQK